MAQNDPSGIRQSAGVFQSLLFPEDTPAEQEQAEETPEQEQEQVQDATSDEAAPEGEEQATNDEAESEDAEPQVEKKTRKVKDIETDEELDVDEDEAENGYLRLADYTRKTQRVADLRRKAEAEAAEANQVRERYAAQLQEAEDMLGVIAPKEPNWAQLKARVTPQEYLAYRDQWDQIKEMRSTIEQNKAKLQQERLTQQQKQMQEYVQQQQERVVELIPEWRDQTMAQKEKVALVQWLRTQGYEDEEIGMIADARLISNLRNAMLYDRARRNAPKPKVKAKDNTRPAAAGATPEAKPKATAREQDMSRLQKSGKVKDAASVFRHFVE